MRIASISTGFIDVPSKISLNIFAQGCKNNCEGCQNPELHDFNGGSEITIDKMKQILDSKSLATWVCWLGGDVTFQPEDLKKFNKLFKERGYKICLYTGQLFEDVKDLLEDVDLIIDGKWEGKLVSAEDTNQKCYIKIDNEWKNIKWKEIRDLIKGEK